MCVLCVHAVKAWCGLRACVCVCVCACVCAPPRNSSRGSCLGNDSLCGVCEPLGNSPCSLAEQVQELYLAAQLQKISLEEFTARVEGLVHQGAVELQHPQSLESRPTVDTQPLMLQDSNSESFSDAHTPDAMLGLGKTNVQKGRGQESCLPGSASGSGSKVCGLPPTFSHP